jgi:hypothetical protein
MKLVQISALTVFVATSLVSVVTPAQALTTVSPDVDGYTVSHSFDINGCTPAPIELTSAVTATIPTDSLVDSSQITITIPVSVRENASGCGSTIDRGYTVQLEHLTGLPTYLQLNTYLSDTVGVGVISGGNNTSGELELTFDVVGSVPVSQTIGLSLDVAAYSILDDGNFTVVAPDNTTDTGYQATLGSPVPPVTAPITGNTINF